MRQTHRASTPPRQPWSRGVYATKLTAWHFVFLQNATSEAVDESETDGGEEQRFWWTPKMMKLYLDTTARYSYINQQSGLEAAVISPTGCAALQRCCMVHGKQRGQRPELVVWLPPLPRPHPVHPPGTQRVEQLKVLNFSAMLPLSHGSEGFWFKSKIWRHCMC